MLARLQQFIVLAIGLAAILWWLLAWTLDWRGFAWWVPAIAPMGYAAALGLEFLLMHRVNGRDMAPRATAGQVTRAWWREVHAGPRVFGWRQPFRSRRWPDAAMPGGAAPVHRGVLFIHGFVCNRGLWNPWMARLAEQGIPYVAVNLEPVFGSIDDYVPVVERGVRELEAKTGQAPVVVAHSMGGLALRRWRSVAGNTARVARVLTLGTPHHGTWLARWALSANGREMRRDSAWLRTLEDREALAGGGYGQFVCFYSHCDNIVFPASTAMLPGADNRHLEATAHVDMADHAAPWQALQLELGRG